MKPAAYVTTSWDDGDPRDLRVAELLAKYELRGTFYVPRHAENITMAPAQIRQLASTFEIGAHTLNHIDLTRAQEPEARQEIVRSKEWLEDCTGQSCLLFCPPMGRYSPQHLAVIEEAGYIGVRSVELLSVAFPRARAGLMVQPTTVQAHPHGPRAYLRNAAKRGAWRNLWQFLIYGRSTDWSKLARRLLDLAIRRGGVFHLWGHSWEVDKHGQWQRLEEVLRFLSQFRTEAPALTNAEVCQVHRAARNGGLRP
jgi:peptidoglycan-N-acetylglucosamine deacetylase